MKTQSPLGMNTSRPAPGLGIKTTNPASGSKSTCGLASLVALAALVASACASSRSEHLPAQGALGPYSAAVSAGNLCFLSGKTGKSAGSLGQDVEAAIDSIEKDLDRLGLTLADVVSVTVFVTDMSAYAELNAAYAKRFPQPYPARTTVAVQALPGGARVEIQAIAARRR